MDSATVGVKSQAKSNVTRVLINIGAGDGAQDDSRQARQRQSVSPNSSGLHQLISLTKRNCFGDSFFNGYYVDLHNMEIVSDGRK